MNHRGSDQYRGYLALAEAVVRQAIEDLANGLADAKSFIESYHFDLWCRLAGLDASKIRGLLTKYGLHC